MLDEDDDLYYAISGQNQDLNNSAMNMSVSCSPEIA